MKKYLLLFVFTIIILFNCCSKNKVNIDIEVTSEVLPEGSSIFITGNDDQLGNWQPGLVQLERTEEGKWEKSFSFDKGKKLEFKLTLGTWETEALNSDSSVPPNFTINILSDTTLKINVDLWADQVERKIEGQITGKVDYYRSFGGKGIKPRDIIVWKTSDYDDDTTRSYGVLYMHDGQNIVDPSTSTFQVDWQLDEAADSLIRLGLIDPIIIVGIYNTPDRDNEYYDVPLGLAYMKFITDSLKPFIDKNYRTKPGKEFTANGGGSLGGLISFIVAWNHSEIFSKALCFSPAFKIDNYDFVEDVLSYRGPKKEIKIYINNGDNELDSSLQPGVDEMIIALKKQKFVEGRDYYFYKSLNSQHSERDWSQNIWRALIFLYGTEKGKSLL